MITRIKDQRRIIPLTLLCFTIFPLLPNTIKGLPVALLLVVSIYIFTFEDHHKTINYKKIIVYTSPYLLYLLGLFYTDNFNGIDKILSTRLSLILLPVSFGVLSSSEKKITKNFFLRFQVYFFIFSTIYALLIWLYVNFIGLFSAKISLNTAYAYITNEMPLINQHPIYASIFFSIAIIFGINILLNKKGNYSFFLIVIGLIILIFTEILLSRKGILLSLFFALVASLILKNKGLIADKKVLIPGLVLLVVLMVALPTPRKRFLEIVNLNTYEKVSINNSTSLRFGIYKCSLQIIEDNIFWGVGTGDVKDSLRTCYTKTSEILTKGNYNSHNQYFSFLLSNGLFGLLIFLFFLYSIFKIAFVRKSPVFLSIIVFFSIIMFFENILERQAGVILFSFLTSFFVFHEIDD